MKQQTYIALYIMALTLFQGLNSACQKQEDYLRKKPRKTDVILSKISDYQLLLNDDLTMNSRYPFGPLASSDNFYLTTQSWQGATNSLIKNSYIWAPDLYEGGISIDWTSQYKKVGNCNIIINGLAEVGKDEKTESAWNQIYGSALFHRAFAFFNLAQTFCKPYAKSSADSDFGIPLRTSNDVTESAGRASLKETYDKVEKDLLEAEKLLPSTAQFKTMPTSIAVNALLARMYLYMGEYEKSLQRCNNVLSLNDSLLDFNSLTTTGTRSPFPTFQAGNKEIIFYANADWLSYLNFPTLIVDTSLIKSYAPNDIRKDAFFRANTTQGYGYKGSYNASATPFSGLATNEIYLIRAECHARNGSILPALADINKLLRARYKANKYTDIEANSAQAALDTILIERRKELPFTGSIRWEDLRRLNQEPRYAVEMRRVINGNTYTISPNSPLYVFPIPAEEIKKNPIPQNQR